MNAKTYRYIGGSPFLEAGLGRHWFLYLGILYSILLVYTGVYGYQ